MSALGTRVDQKRAERPGLELRQLPVDRQFPRRDPGGAFFRGHHQ
jgi:hypothetical protein